MQFNRLPADIADGCHTVLRPFVRRNAPVIYGMTKYICDRFAFKTSMDTSEDCTIILGFSLDVGSSSFRLRRKDFLVSFTVYWEFSAENGRACIHIQNVGGDELDEDFLKFFRDFEHELSGQLITEVDLSI